MTKARIAQLVADIELLQGTAVTGGTLYQRIPLGEPDIIFDIPGELMPAITEVILNHKRKLLADIVLSIK